MLIPFASDAKRELLGDRVHQMPQAYQSQAIIHAHPPCRFVILVEDKTTGLLLIKRL